MVRGALAAILVVCSLASYADEARLRSAEGPVFATATAPPPLRAAGVAEVVISTQGASSDDIAGLRAANGTGSGALHVGVVRELEQPLRVKAGPAALSDGPWRWRGSVHAEGAARVRLRLDRVNLPADARLWIYAGDEAVSFTPALAHAGSLWTPSVGGEVVTLEVEASGGDFTLAALADNRELREVVALGSECIHDAACQTALNLNFARAMARINYISAGRSSMCSGGLLNTDTTGTKVPYFLTANHCLSYDVEAATVEAFWDYRAATCNGAAPPLASLQRTIGASVAATSNVSDMTLLRLSSMPSGRILLGWDPNPVAAGVTLFRLSHPDGAPMRYSQAVSDLTTSTCTDYPRPTFAYSLNTIGATAGGSSGSPVMYDSAAGYVVGQLLGTCGPEPRNACNRLNRDLDGSLAVSWPLLHPFLRPTPAACAACTPNSTTACMLDNRFKVTAAWSDGSFGSGPGLPIRFAENKAQTHPEHGAILETTFFAFYPFFPTSVESMVKMTKGVGINNKYWVFITGFTGASYTVNVLDTKTCATWSKAIEPNATAAFRDYEAFPLN